MTTQRRGGAVHVSERRLAAAFKCSPDAIVITSVRDGKVLEVNDAALRLTGYAREELVGHGHADLRFWDREEERDRYLELLRSAGRVTEMEAAFRTRSGEVRSGLISGELMDVGGEPQILSVIRDLTPRHRAEEALRILNAELERRVAERTKELAERNEELETFTYSVSHDLKAPLRGLDGYSQLLLEDHAERLDEEGREFLDNIRRAARNMNQLIDDLLAYSRVERRVAKRGRVDITALVRDVLAERREEAAARGVAVVVESLPVSAIADQEGLELALRNLVDNAFKFTRERPDAAVTIGGAESEQTVTLWVRDNGIGFEMRFQDRIFEIFQRLHREEDYPGTGIGLAIVRKALERMGGRAWAESVAGQGATFWLEMPR